MRVLSGIQPSGVLHIGNYFGMMRPCIELQNQGESYLFIADYHSLTQLPDPDRLRELVAGVALDFLACGLNEETIFFRQSEIPEIFELTWVLCCQANLGLLERCHSYKDKVAHGIKPNHGLFTYPVLMAADILAYKSTTVPVGKDQVQHLEVTRDIAIRFNNRYGNVFVIPEGRVQESVAVVPGVDGQKMSKSYDNIIEIFGPEKQMRKKIMKIVTDCTPMEAPKDPAACNVFSLFKLFGSEEQVQALQDQYTRGGMGYGHAKQALFEVYWEYFRPMRARREELLANLDYVTRVLTRGAERARDTAAQTLAEVRKATGIR